MAQTLKGIGTPVNFGFVSTASDGGLTCTGLTGFLLQRSSFKTAADKEQLRTLQGDVVSENYYNDHDEADLTFVIASTGKAAAITATSLANFRPGSIIAITDCASNPDLVNSHWIVQAGAEIPQEVTKSAEMRIPLQKYAGITAVQAS